MAGKAKQSKPKAPQRKKKSAKEPAKAKVASAASVPGKAQPPRFKSLGQIYNPFLHIGPVPVADYEGKAVCMRSMLNTQYTADPDNDTLLLFLNTGHGVKMAGKVVLSTTPTVYNFAGNFLRESAAEGGASSGRAMRLGVELQNTSKRVDMGGRVFTLVSNERQQLPAAADNMTKAQWQALVDDIVTNPKTEGINGALLETPLRLYSTPHTQKSYLQYEAWTGNNEGVNSFFKHATCLDGEMFDMPMSAIWVVIKASTAVNSYNFRVHADFNLRFSAGNVLSTKMGHTPTVPAAALNAAGIAGSELGRGTR
jgi:hypothetical protein